MNDIADADTTTARTFGEAIEALKQGKRVARAGWNGKGMFVFLNKGALRPNSLVEGGSDSPTKCEGIRAELFENVYGEGATRLPNINMHTATGSTVTGWLASQTDMLSEDWVILA